MQQIYPALKRMRKLWGNVTGERLWYALHGYDIKAQPSKRGMYGHGRVLPPEMRTIRDAYYCSRIRPRCIGLDGTTRIIKLLTYKHKLDELEFA